MRKRLSLILAVLILLCLTGCDTSPETENPNPDTTPTVTQDESDDTTKREIALAYSHDDTFNPFSTATEVNGQLTGLLYEGLAAISDGFAPTTALAAKIEKTDDTHLTVTLRKGAVFSDGSKVTPEDVTASFKAAKKSDRYRRLLENVSSASEREQTVVFTLSSADPNAKACLIFPVVKADTLTDKAGEAPIGTGPYVVKSTKTGHQLKKNPQYTADLPYQTVSLRHLPNRTARQHGVASGEISYCYDDLSEGDIPRLSGANRSVEMNDLVYLGMNTTKGKLKDATVRQALSQLIDRQEVVTTTYTGWATASAYPFHPKWKSMKDKTGDTAVDTDGALSLLEEAGATAKTGDRLELELIYSIGRADRAKIADTIRTQLEVAGIEITTVPLEEEEYLERLKAGKYDLYVGEIRLTADHSLRPLLMGGDASYGIDKAGQAAKVYKEYLSGDKKLTEFLKVFSQDMPYIPLCWRDGIAAFDRRLTAVTPTGYDPYAGFAGWQ